MLARKQDQPVLPRPTRSHIYLIHRWDLVPFILRGVIHIHLRRIVPVGGRRGGNVLEPGGSIPGCEKLERIATEALLLWELL